MIQIENLTLYLRQSNDGSFISTNHHFHDSVIGQLTFTHPHRPGYSLQMKTLEALKIIPALKNYWLHQLNIHIFAEKES